jgi:hypothetical protein
MRVKLLSFVLLLISTSIAVSDPLPAPPECDVTLFRTMISEKVQQENYVFFFDLVTRDNYQQMQTSIGATVPGYFDGSYDQFSQKRDNYKKQIQLVTQDKYSRDYAISTLSETGLKAYTACLEAQTPKNTLIVYRNTNVSADQQVTFVVNLKTDVELAGNVLVDVFGAGKVLNSVDGHVKISYSDGVAHIAIDRLTSGKQFTIQRRSTRQELRVTAQIAGLVAAPLVVGPKLTTTIKDVQEEVTSQGSFLYMARRLENGSFDFIYGIDGQPGVQIRETFMGNACLCASGKRTPATLPFNQAGICAPAPDPSKDRLLQNTVVLQPATLRAGIQCADQKQGPASILTTSDQGVCYGISLSLNAPDQWSTSKQCTVNWTLTGTVIKHKLEFVN